MRMILNEQYISWEDFLKQVGNLKLEININLDNYSLGNGWYNYFELRKNIRKNDKRIFK